MSQSSGTCKTEASCDGFQGLLNILSFEMPTFVSEHDITSPLMPQLKALVCHILGTAEHEQSSVSFFENLVVGFVKPKCSIQVHCSLFLNH